MHPDFAPGDSDTLRETIPPEKVRRTVHLVITRVNDDEIHVDVDANQHPEPFVSIGMQQRLTLPTVGGSVEVRHTWKVANP